MSPGLLPEGQGGFTLPLTLRGPSGKRTNSSRPSLGPPLTSVAHGPQLGVRAVLSPTATERGPGPSHLSSELETCLRKRGAMGRPAGALRSLQL